MLNRFGNGWLTSVDNAAEGVSGLLGENIGSFVGGAIGGYTGLIRGAINSLLGYKYAFYRIYGIDIRRAGIMSPAYLDVERIG